jgi:hypothetical protein
MVVVVIVSGETGTVPEVIVSAVKESEVLFWVSVSFFEQLRTIIPKAKISTDFFIIFIFMVGVI